MFFCFHVVGLLWTEDMAWGLHIVHKMWYFLLLLPVLITIVRKDNINKYGILNYEMVNSIWEAHLTGKEMHNELWGILMLQNWLINQDK